MGEEELTPEPQEALIHLRAEIERLERERNYRLKLWTDYLAYREKFLEIGATVMSFESFLIQECDRLARQVRELGGVVDRD